MGARAEVAFVPPHLAYCDEAEAPKACPCEPGYTCVRTKADGTADDWQCQAVWAVDCGNRCLPAVHPPILCHGNNEIHGVWLGSDPKWMAVKTSSDCAGANGWAWRVWGVQPDLRPRATLDSIVLSTWQHTTPNCTAEPPDGANLPDYFANNPAQPVYLLMPPNYGGATGEILTP